jgi:hypothetical protein
MSNILSWGDQIIPHPVEEVADLESFSYDKKQKYIKITHRKRKVSLDSSVLRTTDKVIIDTKKYNMN